MKWYVVHTQPGSENKALTTLQERIRHMSMQEQFGQILMPTEPVTETVKGQKRTVQRKFYPGYIFVQMELNDATFHLVKNTPKISGFLGGKKPTSVNEKDIHQVNQQITTGVQRKSRVSFDVGDQVKVVQGPFANFTGVIDEVKADKQRLKVRFSIFGRASSVELEDTQVEKVS